MGFRWQGRVRIVPRPKNLISSFPGPSPTLGANNFCLLLAGPILTLGLIISVFVLRVLSRPWRDAPVVTVPCWQFLFPVSAFLSFVERGRLAVGWQSPIVP